MLEEKDFCPKLLQAWVGGKGIPLGQKLWHLCRLQCSECDRALGRALCRQLPVFAPRVDFNMKGVCCKAQNHKHLLLFAAVRSSPALLFLLGKSVCVYLCAYTYI